MRDQKWMEGQKLITVNPLILACIPLAAGSLTLAIRSVGGLNKGRSLIEAGLLLEPTFLNV